VTIDELIETVRTFAAVNHPDRVLQSVSLKFVDGAKSTVLMPVDRADDANRHAVEVAILAALRGGARLPHKVLKRKVMQATGYSAAIFDRSLRRLRDEGEIRPTADGYALNGEAGGES